MSLLHRCVVLGLGTCLAIACKPRADESTASVKADGDAIEGEPAVNQGEGQWSTFCAGGSRVSDVVNPNYQNADVLKAAQLLSKVNHTSYALYSDMMAMHATAKPTLAEVPDLTNEAHDFLTYLCGEFRDRPDMLKAKIDWVNTLTLTARAGGKAKALGKSCAPLNDPLNSGNGGELPAYDPSASPWLQMCSEDYGPFLQISNEVFSLRERAVRTPGASLDAGDEIVQTTGPLKIGSRAKIDRTIPGFTICETKYLFAEYVKKGKTFRQGGANDAARYKAYLTGYKNFTACAPEDKEWYYDYRGDSNFKPNTPESNAMIDMGRAAAAMCKPAAAGAEARGTAVSTKVAMSDADCRKYYENPYQSRLQAARATLGSWLLYDNSHAAIFAKRPTNFNDPMSGEPWTVANHKWDNPKDVFSSDGPFSFRIKDTLDAKRGVTKVGQPGKFSPGALDNWNDADLGLAKLNPGSKDPKEFMYTRLQLAVDRHTNWYSSAYDRAPTLPLNDKIRRTRSVACSPFVASSYEMSKSDGFTRCGPTIPCKGDPDFDQHRHWMYIFKIRKANWYKPEHLAADQAIDFTKNWFDETAFGDDGLANTERAWDRLGSPQPEEFSEILYLYNM